MTIEQAAEQLKIIHMSYDRQIQAVRAKRSWRDSEKAMTIATYRDRQRGLEQAYEALTSKPMLKKIEL